jgi:hypothetical protein
MNKSGEREREYWEIKKTERDRTTGSAKTPQVSPLFFVGMK